MNRFVHLFILILSAIIFCAGCNKNEPERKDFTGIENINVDNYPNVDGSTSAQVLNTITACKLLNIKYEWNPPGIVTEWTILPDWQSLPEKDKLFFYERVKTSQTHGAFMNLIDGNADIILTHRTISPDEKAHADEVGVSLIEKPIALDAFVFVVNKNNPVRSLTVEQIQKIYTGEITNWSQVGGNDAAIKVYTRPRNSGSEEIFRELVMKGIEPAAFPESGIGGMSQVFVEILYNENAICYSFNTFKKMQARVAEEDVPNISVNNVYPDDNTTGSRTYPFIAEVHVAIRSNLDHNSMAYKLYEWLQSDIAKATIEEAGFLAK
jgi:phosphate transport system substrate-binding protein